MDDPVKRRDDVKYGSIEDGYGRESGDNQNSFFLPQEYWRLTEQMSLKAYLRKLYSILSLQLLLTAGVCAFFVIVEPARHFVLQHPSFAILGMVLSLLLLIAMFFYSQTYPYNAYLLCAWTFLEAYTIGTIGAAYASAGMIALLAEAAGITLIVFVSLTAYTLTSRRDFSFLGMGLSCSLFLLVGWGLVYSLLGWQTGMWYGILGSLLFSAYIIYDTWAIINRSGEDDYIYGAISLYLDIINLFFSLLTALRGWIWSD